MVPREECTHHSPTPPWGGQPSGGCRVTHNERSYRLELEPSAVPEDGPIIWPNRSRSVCIQEYSTVPSLLQLAARSLCSRNRCIPPGLVTHKSCEPSKVPNRQGSSTGSDSAGPDTTQPWYPLLLTMLVDFPRLIDQTTQVATRLVQPMLTPQLATWPISGRDTETRSFQRKPPHYYSGQGGLKPTNLMTTSGVAGVIEGVQIPYK